MKTAEASALEQARQRLGAAGLDADAPSRALAALVPAWGADLDLAEAVVRVLAETDDPAVGDELAALVERTRQRELRREIKRALYRLTQRGVWKPPEAAAPPPTSQLMGSSEEEPQGWLSPIDPTGTRLLWLARRAGDGVASLSAIASEEGGLRELHAGQTTRKALREAQRDLSARSGISLVETPWAHVHRLIREAYDAASDRSRFGDVPSKLQMLVPKPPESPPHPVDALLDRTEIGADESALAESARALEEPELRAWLLPFEWVEAAAARVREAGSSLVVLTPTQQRERLAESFSKETLALFEDQARRARFATRLEETAYLLARRGRRATARNALAAAIAARGTRAITEVPLLAELARRSLGLALETQEEQGRKAAAPSGLVVTPAQALAEERRRRSRR